MSATILVFRYEITEPGFSRMVLLANVDDPGPQFRSTEAKFREVARANLPSLPGAELARANYRAETRRASGCYWNLSRLWIPSTEGDGYKIAYYS
jgi:hypothetical protein